MPIYAFQCSECGHAFDRLQKMSDPDPDACPACSAHAVRRQVTAPSFRLSGSGWYETDFKKDGDRKRNLTESGEGAGSKGEASGEGKPEGKGETRADGGEAKAPAAGSAGGETSAKPAAPGSPAPTRSEPKPAPKTTPPASPAT